MTLKAFGTIRLQHTIRQDIERSIPI